MGKYKKQIVSAGVYLVSTPDGSRKKEVITPERIHGWANTISELRKAGHQIPAPFYHDLESVPVLMNDQEALNAASSSDKNGGFWNDVSVEVGDDEVPRLVGTLESSHDDKIGKTVKETSIYVKPEWTDGTGKVWRDVPLHIALVTHPIEPNQSNFELVEDDLAIAMSDMSKGMTMSYDLIDMPEKAADSSFASLLQDLKAVAKIDLGDDTTPEDLVTRLLIALRQKKACEQDEESSSAGSVSTPPDGAVRESVPIQMSNENKDMKVEDSQEYKALQQQNESLLMAVTTNKKDSLALRVKQLLESKRITEAYAEELKKSLEGFKMSFDSSGKEIQTPLEIKLEALEASVPPADTENSDIKPVLMNGLPAGHVVEGSSNEMSVSEFTKHFMQSTR